MDSDNIASLAIIKRKERSDDLEDATTQKTVQAFDEQVQEPCVKKIKLM